MMERKSAPEQRSIRKWLEQSSFMTCETDNIFEAIDGISDFTVRERPDVIVLDVDSCTADLPFVLTMMDGMSNNQFEHIIALSDDLNTKESGGCFAKDLTQVANRIERLVSGGASALN